MKHIGIDLGTTNSLVGLKKIKAEIIPNAENQYMTRSCIYEQKVNDVSKKNKLKSFFGSKSEEKTEFIVGDKAYQWIKQDPENTIVSVKRLIGRGLSEPEIQEIINKKKLNYKIEEFKEGTANTLSVILNNKPYLPEELSAEILKKIKKDTESNLGEIVENAVITVPAYFNDKQKYATRIAAQTAGFKVMRLLSESTAAAISFGINEMGEDEAKTVLVYDFGGGTFDVSVLTIVGGQFIEQGKDGDMWLGGDDIDRLLLEYVYQKVKEENDIEDIEETLKAMPVREQNIFRGTLVEKIEKAKIELSSKESTIIEVLGLLKDEGDLIDIEVEISRTIFNDILKETVSESIEICKKVISEINLTPEMIDNYLLIGGSTNIPLVQEMMKKEFGEEKVLIHERPMFAVAEGAAILAHKLSGENECTVCGTINKSENTICSKCGFDFVGNNIKSEIEDIVYSSSHDYYILLANGDKHKIIEKNMPLPIDIVEIFKTESDNQKIIHLQFINIAGEQDESIGDLWMTLSEDYPKGTELAVNIKIDSDNVLEVKTNLLKNSEVLIEKTLSRGLSDEKLFCEIEKIVARSKENMFILKTKRMISQSVDIISKANSLVDKKTGKVNQKLYSQLFSEVESMKFEAQSNISPQGLLYYTKNLMDNVSYLFEDAYLQKLEKHTEKIEKLLKGDNITELYATCEKLDKLLDEIPPLADVINKLMKMVEVFDTNNKHKEKKEIEKALNIFVSGIEEGSFAIKPEVIGRLIDKHSALYNRLVNKEYSVGIDKGVTK